MKDLEEIDKHTQKVLQQTAQDFWLSRLPVGIKESKVNWESSPGKRPTKRIKMRR